MDHEPESEREGGAFWSAGGSDGQSQSGETEKEKLRVVSAACDARTSQTGESDFSGWPNSVWNVQVALVTVTRPTVTV